MAITKLVLGDTTASVADQIAERLRRANEDMQREMGSTIQVNSSFRTPEEQARLHKELSVKGARVAPPGSSFHEKGQAVDVSNWQEAEKYLRRYNLVNDLDDDKGHFSYGETRQGKYQNFADIVANKRRSGQSDTQMLDDLMQSKPDFASRIESSRSKYANDPSIKNDSDLINFLSVKFSGRDSGVESVPVATQAGVQAEQPGPKQAELGLGGQLSKRAGSIMEAISEARENPLNLLGRTQFRVGGALTGAAVDILDKVIGGLEDDYAEAFPAYDKELVRESLVKLTEGSPAQEAVQSFEVWEPDHPELAQDIRDIANMLLVGGIKLKVPELSTGPKVDLSKVIDVEAIGMKVGPVAPGVAKALDEAITKGIKPKMRGTAAQTERFRTKAKQAFVVINEKRTSFTDDAGISVQRNPTNRSEMLDAIGQSKKQVFSEYDSLAKESGLTGARIDIEKIVTSLEKVTNDLSFSPEIRNYANTLIPAISELQGASPSVIQARIQDFNNSLGSFYEGRVSKGRAQLDASVANLLRVGLDKQINSLTGANYQALKNQYGALSTIERDVARQVAVEARKADKGLIDFTDIFTGGDLLFGLVGANPAMIAKGLTGRALKEYFKYINNPNRYIKKVFDALEQSDIKPIPRQKPSISGLLPEGGVRQGAPKGEARLFTQEEAKASLGQSGEFPKPVARPGQKQLGPGRPEASGPTINLPANAARLTSEAPAKKIGEGLKNLNIKKENIPPSTIESLKAQIDERVESFRLGAGLKAEREGAGVRHRNVLDARGEVEFVAKDFSRKRAMGNMARQKRDNAQYAKELMYENDPIFRAMVDKFDDAMEKRIDDAVVVQDLDSIPFLDDEITTLENNLKTYEGPTKKEPPAPSSLKGLKKESSPEAPAAKTSLIAEAKKFKSADEFIEAMSKTPDEYPRNETQAQFLARREKGQLRKDSYLYGTKQEIASTRQKYTDIWKEANPGLSNLKKKVEAPAAKKGLANLKAKQEVLSELKEGLARPKKTGPGAMAQEELALAQTLREAKGLTVEDIVKKHPDIQLKRDVPVKDIHGNKDVIDAGEVLTPYELKGNKVLLQDGQTYIVSKNQFANVKGNALSGEAKPFAPELEGLEESVLGKALPKSKALAQKDFEDGLITSSEMDRLIKGEVSLTKYSQYQLPGGEDYVEILIKAPEKPVKTASIPEPKMLTELPEGYGVSRDRNPPNIAKGNEYTIVPPNQAHGKPFGGIGGNSGYFATPAEAKAGALQQLNQVTQSKYNTELAKATEEANRGINYKDPHFGEPTISHLRINKRTYKGKKVTFMEEAQSDWAREGRDRGFAREAKDVYEIRQDGGRFQAVDRETGKVAPFNSFSTKAKAEQHLNNYGKLKGLPFHPLVKGNKWQEPTVKRALQEAVADDADYFAWINGDQTSARYNLATYLDDVNWKSVGGGKNLDLKDVTLEQKGGGSIWMNINQHGEIMDSTSKDWIGKKLDEVLGKGLADSIMAKESGTLSGEGLKFGGEWANNLYDKQIKNIVEKVTGGKVEVMDMGLPIDNADRRIFKTIKVEKEGKTTPLIFGDFAGDLTIKDIKAGKPVALLGTGEMASSPTVYIITDVLGDGKFKAISKREMQVQLDNNEALYNKYIIPESRGKDGEFFELNEAAMDKIQQKALEEGAFEDFVETFDISTKTTTQLGIKLTPEIKARIRGEALELRKGLSGLKKE